MEVNVKQLQIEVAAGKRLWMNAQRRCKAQALRGDKLQTENKQLKTCQKIMQNEVDAAQDAELELLALRDENKALKKQLSRK